MKQWLFLLSALLLPLPSFGQTYSVDWFKVAGGGGTSTGGIYTATVTIGQADAGGPMQGGGYSVEGGFWSLYATQTSTATGTAPSITSQPEGVLSTNATQVYFSVAFSGTPPIFLQWQENGTNLNDGNGISGSGTSNLVVSATSFNENGNYDVVIENAYGSVTSSVASLQLNFVVTTTNDSGPGSLRQAINNAPSGTTITFAPNLSGQTILLASTLNLSNNFTIDGSALPGGIQISGKGSVGPILNCTAGATNVLNSLTITNGYNQYTDQGGGIFNNGTMTLNKSTLSGNRSSYTGGGVFNNGTMAVNQCTFSGNEAAYGAAVYNGSTDYNTFGTYSTNITLMVNECTMSGNIAGESGGGIYNGNSENAVTIVNQSTLSRNTGYYCGGIYNYGTISITNCVVAGNSNNSASGYSANDIFLENDTPSFAFGGSNMVQQLYSDYGVIPTGPLSITNSPNLAPLGNYGGPTATMPPLPGSPAIGAGSVAANTFTTDQRGYPRTQNGLIDIGAVELPVVQFTASPTAALVNHPVQFTGPATDSDGTTITQWDWSFGDTTTGANQNPSHTYATIGEYSPNLIVTNSLGMALAASGPAINVFSQPSTTVSIQSGNNLVFSGAGLISGQTYYLLSSTNLLLPLSLWTPVATNILGANGSFSLTLTNFVNSSVPKQFFTLQLFNGATETTNPPQFTADGMALIPAGVFTMGNYLIISGSPTNDPDITDANSTNIYVSAFYMDTNLVSFSQWEDVYNYATSHGYSFNDTGSPPAINQPLDQPVENVDWFDCVKWSNARSQQSGLTPVYYTDAAFTQVYTNGDNGTTVYQNMAANGYRLPTEAEWEKAARGGLSGQRFPWGLTISESQANYYAYPNPPNSFGFTYDLGPYTGYNTNFDVGYPYTSPVGSFAANGYGLYDMAGNVYEWCWDWYGTPYGQSSNSNPTGAATGSYRVLRGGNWLGYADYARCAYRDANYPDNAGDSFIFGFRCVRGL